MASLPESKPGTSFEAASFSGTSFAGGHPVIHNQPHVQGGDAALHMNKTVYNYGANSPFTEEDVCQSLKAMLQARYRNIRFPKMPWIDWNYEFPLEHYFVKLTVTEKGNKLKKSPAKQIKFQEIFNQVRRKNSTRILIEGQAGYGKSTLALKLCHDYAKGEDYISHFQVVALFPLREFKDGKINEMLIKKLNLGGHPPDQIINSVMKNEKSVAIILDGFDEADQKTRENLKLLLKSEFLPGVTVIVTTRPGAVETIDDFDKRIDIKGITGTNKGKFIELHLQSCSEEQRRYLREFLSTNFNIKFGNTLTRKIKKVFWLRKEEENLLNCPLFLLLVVSVAKNSYPSITSFSSKTDLYKKLFNFVAERTLKVRFKLEQKVDLFNFDGTHPPSYVTSLSQFGKLALNALTAKQFTFTKEEILSSSGGDDIVLQMGLLTENDWTDDIAGQHSSWYQPIHLSILEFCAAYHLLYDFRCHLVTFDFPIDMLPDLSGRVEFFVFLFFVGLCENVIEEFFSSLTQVSKMPQDLIRRFCRCESMMAESTLEHGSLINALLLLVPKVWKTSCFKDGKYRATKLLKEAVAEALNQERLECIVHDADLDWDIALGNIVCVPMFALAINSSKESVRRTYENVNCQEVRVFLDRVTTVQAVAPTGLIVTLVEEENSAVTSRVLKQIYESRDFLILRALKFNELTVVRCEEDNFIGMKVGLYERIPKEYHGFFGFTHDPFYERATEVVRSKLEYILMVFTGDD